MPRLKLNRFRKIYKSLKTPWKPINWLILGMLVGLEQRWVNLKAEQTVDMAIDEYMEEHDDTVYKAVIKEVEDGFTIGYFPEEDES